MLRFLYLLTAEVDSIANEGGDVVHVLSSKNNFPVAFTLSQILLANDNY